MGEPRRHLGTVVGAIIVAAASLGLVTWVINVGRARNAAAAAADMLEKGRRASREGDYGRAEAFHRQGLAAGADPAEAWHLIGVALRGQGRFEGALEAYGRSLEIGGESQVRLTNRANALRVLGRLDEAEVDYRRAAHLDAEYPRAWCGLARVAEGRGDFAGAVGFYGRAVGCGLSQARAGPWVYLALVRSGRADEAPGVLTAGLADTGPERSCARFLAGRISPMKFLQGAGADSERLTRAHYYLGMRFLIEGEADLARRHLESAVSLGRYNSVEYSAARAELARLSDSD